MFISSHNDIGIVSKLNVNDSNTIVKQLFSASGLFSALILTSAWWLHDGLPVPMKHIVKWKTTDR